MCKRIAPEIHQLTIDVLRKNVLKPVAVLSPKIAEETSMVLDNPSRLVTAEHERLLDDQLKNMSSSDLTSIKTTCRELPATFRSIGGDLSELQTIFANATKVLTVPAVPTTGAPSQVPTEFATSKEFIEKAEDAYAVASVCIAAFPERRTALTRAWKAVPPRYEKYLSGDAKEFYSKSRFPNFGESITGVDPLSHVKGMKESNPASFAAMTSDCPIIEKLLAALATAPIRSGAVRDTASMPLVNK